MKRVLSATALAVPLLFILWFAPPIVFLFLVLIVAFIAGWECSGFLLACGWSGRKWEVALDASALALAVGTGGLIAGLALTLIVLRVLVQALYAGSPREGITGAGVSVLAALWIGGPAGLFAASRAVSSDGRELIIFLLVVVWANDIGAYYFGRALGRRKLAPSISPGKTVEGAIGGLASGVVAGAALAVWIGEPGGGMLILVSVSLLLGLFAQAGDLFESLFKRAAGAKDSGALIPGHGGILDRIDGLLLAAPPFYYFLKWTAVG
ncbi:MAG: phosphatidate cytidylyltransferase [bacterium]